jgi:hypothetical protein
MKNVPFFSATHLIAPGEKDAAWAAQVMYEKYFFGGATSLMEGKKPDEIRKYVAGEQSVDKFKKMFRKAAAGNVVNAPGTAGTGRGGPLQDMAGIDWQPLALLTQPFNAAISIIQKMPLYVKCTAIDPLAKDKKMSDAEFLRNRQHLDASLAQFSALLGAPIEPPSAPNNAASADISAFDLNPAVEDELNFYMDLFYKLRPETAFENVLQALAYMNSLRTVR